MACIFGHKWNGCKCSKCGKVRDMQHNWTGCKCLKCGKTRDEQHEWNGCKCSKCYKTRDEQHSWNGCKCLKCGKPHDDARNNDNLHDWNYKTGVRCKKCDGIRYFCSRCKKSKYSYMGYNQAVNDVNGCKCPMCGGVRKEHLWDGINRNCIICGVLDFDFDKRRLERFRDEYYDGNPPR